jgi:hypothetical protein
MRRFLLPVFLLPSRRTNRPKTDNEAEIYLQLRRLLILLRMNSRSLGFRVSDRAFL